MPASPPWLLSRLLAPSAPSLSRLVLRANDSRPLIGVELHLLRAVIPRGTEEVKFAPDRVTIGRAVGSRVTSIPSFLPSVFLLRGGEAQRAWRLEKAAFRSKPLA